MDKYGSPEQAWENGQGADAVSLWLFNINFDFHGPLVWQSAVVKVAKKKGIQTSQCESWPKHTWIDVAERAGDVQVLTRGHFAVRSRVEALLGGRRRQHYDERQTRGIVIG